MLPLTDSDPPAIASYRLLGVLGSGGMGRVYLGESRSGRRVAIKVVRSDLAADPDWRRRFAREAAAVRQVNPLFTAAVVDADTEAAEPWLATTYIDGPSLSVLVKTSGPLAPGACLVLAAGLAEALAAIHRAGLVHRDLKPSNVIVNDEGPHIIDFGIALTAETPATTSMLLGTPSYIAPERIHGSEAERASDIFSLGATLAFASTGKPLVNEGPVYAQLMQITTGKFDFSGVPADLRPLVQSCVSLEPGDRPSADELSRVLGVARVPSPSPGWYAAADPVRSVPVVPPPGRRLSRRRVLVAGGVVAAAAAVSGVVTLLPSPPPVPRAYAMPPPKPPPTTEPPPPPPEPGDVVWQARSGAVPLSPSPGTISQGSRILVDDRRIITANGPELYALDLSGREKWRVTLQAGLVTLRRWGDAVLVNDPRRLWMIGFDGHERWMIDAAGDEEKQFAAANADNPVQVSGVALSPDLAFVSVGTGTIAVARNGTRMWRVDRPPRRGAEVRPQLGGPNAATPSRLLTHYVGDAGVHAALCDTTNGKALWNKTYGVPDDAYNVPSGPPGGGGGGGPGPGGEQGVDEDWNRDEARIGGDYAILREGRHLIALSLATGAIIWERQPPTPIAAIEIMGDELLIAADRLTAISIASTAERWQLPWRGARIAVALDGQSFVVASEGRMGCYDAGGAELWNKPLPQEVDDTMVDEVTVDAHTAYITFKARGQRRDPLPIDVLGVALDPLSPRHPNDPDPRPIPTR